MACLQGCNDCECHETNICDSTETMEKELNAKLKVLNDYVCLIAMTSCANIPKVMSQYAYMLWCLLKDLVNYLINLDKRVSNLCSSIKCVNNKANSIINYLKLQAFGNISADLKVSTAVDAGGRSIMDVTQTPEHNFTFHFTTDSSVRHGHGFIEGGIDMNYEVDGDGNMVANIKSIIIRRAYWNMLVANNNPNKNLSLIIKDLNGNQIYRKNYDGMSSWRDEINKTVNLNIRKVITPHSSTGDLRMLTIDDNWIINTHGYAAVNFTNNNDAFPIKESDCGIDCDKCK